MIATGRRSPQWLALRTCWQAAAVPTGLAAIAAAAMARLWRPELADAAAASNAAAAPWLALPVLVAMAIVLASALRLWPLFARERPGAAWLLRWQRGPWRGLGAVTAGAAAAFVLLALPTVALLAPWLGAPPAAHAVLYPSLPSAPPPLLTDPGDRVVATFAAPVALRELRLRPRAGPPRGAFVPSELQLSADGQPFATARFEQDLQLLVVPAPGTPMRTLELHLTAGSVPLWLDAEAVVAVEATPRSALANAAAYVLLATVPLLLALALAMLAGSAAALPTVALVAGATLFVTTIGSIGPFDPATDDLLRGRWLLDERRFRTAGPFLALAAVAMMLRMLLLRRPAR